MTISALLLGALVVGGTLLTSGVLKLRDLAGTVAGIERLDLVPRAATRSLAHALPVVEVAAGAALLVTTGPVLVAAALAATALLAAFTVVVLRLLARTDEVSCACFGSGSDEPVSRLTLARNVGLLALALLVAATAPSARGVLPALSDATAPEALLGLASAAGVGAVAVLVGRVATERRRVAVLAERLEAVAAAPSRAAPVPIPEAAVVDAGGEARTLTGLSGERAQLVIGVSPGCSACHDLAPMLPRWRAALGEELDVVLLANSGPEAALGAYGDHGDHLYADPSGEAFGALGIGGTPAALLLGTNGTVAAGPALGLDAILELVTAVVQAIGVNVMTGRAHQTQEGRPAGGEDNGDAFLPAPGFVAADVLVRDERGREQPLSAALAALTTGRDDVAVVSWRNGCGYCGEIVEQMRFFSDTGDVVLLVNEPVSTVREQGIEGPVLQVLDADASGVLAVPGTPAGYPVRGRAMQPGGGVGGGSVLRMLRERAVANGTLSEEQAAGPAFGGAPLPVTRHGDGAHDHVAHDHAHAGHRPHPG